MVMGDATKLGKEAVVGGDVERGTSWMGTRTGKLTPEQRERKRRRHGWIDDGSGSCGGAGETSTGWQKDSVGLMEISRGGSIGAGSPAAT
ncbi:hypothetical protein M0R45_015950 [Rubus argutus]|uniref:Uncharacterized protein n=1 Tax=Rubus argutus TaxID=59490 RepID=A0AAW1XRM3_RUBAR